MYCHLYHEDVIFFSGSEWDYVIISTVRSCDIHDIDVQADRAWQEEHIGVLLDEHFVNTAITRARKGLVILGV